MNNRIINLLMLRLLLEVINQPEELKNETMFSVGEKTLKLIPIMVTLVSLLSRKSHLIIISNT